MKHDFLVAQCCTTTPKTARMDPNLVIYCHKTPSDKKIVFN
jgi:hypothetical protein